MNRLYCTVDELLEDLDAEGVRVSPARVLDKIRAASQWIDRRIGAFIPVTETRYFDGDGTREVYVDPLLSLTSITVDEISVTASEALVYPRNRLWQHGPGIRLVADPDAVSFYAFTRSHNNVAVTGRWGLYEDTRATGATTASQAEDAESLVVDNAAGISPGAVVLVEDEQEVVTGHGSPTDSTADSAEALTTEDEVVTVSDGTKVSIGEVIRIEFEQMKVLDIAGNDLLVSRGWNLTKRASHDSGKDVDVYRTFTVSRGANGTTAAAHSDAAISRYVAPEDIRWLCKQMAGLMLKKADSGFSGRVGSPETGETFYLNEFPNSVIEKIERNYFLPYL